MATRASQEWTDSDLARRCRQGDERAWRELVRRTSPTVWRLALRMLRAPADAEEASQEVFSNMVRSFHTFDPTRPLAPWAARITYHVCLKRLARAAPTEALDEGDARAASALPSPEGMAAAQELRELVEGAVGRLSAQDRALLTMHYRESLSMAEVSEATGMPTGTIKARLSRARARLREMLAPALGGGGDVR